MSQECNLALRASICQRSSLGKGSWRRLLALQCELFPSRLQTLWGFGREHVEQVKSTEASQAAEELLAEPAAALLPVRSSRLWEQPAPPRETSLPTVRDTVAIWVVKAR